MRVILLLSLFVLYCSASNSLDENENPDDMGMSAQSMKIVQEKLNLIRNTLLEQLEQNTIEKFKTENLTKLHSEKTRDHVRGARKTINEVNKNANLKNLYQGDIVLNVRQAEAIAKQHSKPQRNKRQAYKDEYYPFTIWGDTVHYFFDKSATPEVKAAFLKGAAYWSANTCINFKESTTARNRLRVVHHNGCYAYIGMEEGVQDLSLGPGCENFISSIHELGHALGFYHTQSRYDRDDAIVVNLENVKRGFIDEFDKETTETNFNYGIPYDYGSVMHYGALGVSKNKKPVMLAKDPKYQDTMGSDIVAFYDLSMLNEHYNCKARCSSVSSAKCFNGGFPHPRNCSSCICPSGYGGTLCNERPSGCGKTVTATSSFKRLRDVLGDGSLDVKDDFVKCHYWIQAPLGSRIEVRIKYFRGSYSDGCGYGGVEIKTHEDVKRTGYRFCSRKDAGTTLISTSNIVPVITFNNYDVIRTVLEYRIAP